METTPIINDRLFRYAEALGFGEIHVKIDKKSGLRAIIAVHNTQRGSAIGGCRLMHYDNAEAAVKDVLNLARLMSLKAAVSDLPHGGAKAVIIAPDEITDRSALFDQFGQFIETLGGHYVTAIDFGTNPADMDIIAKHTKFVTCTTDQGDPSSFTSLGVRRSIEAAVTFKFGKDSLEGLHIAIQGAGHTGYHLAKECHQLGASITQCDIKQSALQRCIDEFGVKPVTPDQIYTVPCDIFAPCAFGGILNNQTIGKLTARIVAGTANSQLANRYCGELLHQRDILYAPDFVINAGGLIRVATLYDHVNPQKADQQIMQLYNTTLALFERAKAENRPTSKVAESLAMEKLGINL